MSNKSHSVSMLIDKCRHEFGYTGEIPDDDLQALSDALAERSTSNSQRADIFMLLGHVSKDETLLPDRFGLYDKAKKADPSIEDSVNITKAETAFNYGVDECRSCLESISRPGKLSGMDAISYWETKLMLAKVCSDIQEMTIVLQQIPEALLDDDLLKSTVDECRAILKQMGNFYEKRKKELNNEGIV